MPDNAYREAQKRPEEVLPNSTPPNEEAIRHSTMTATQARLALEGTERKAATFAASESSGLIWTGETPAQKWMNFYTKVLANVGVVLVLGSSLL